MVVTSVAYFYFITYLVASHKQVDLGNKIKSSPYLGKKTSVVWFFEF
jgi:hypothetical protein